MKSFDSITPMGNAKLTVLITNIAMSGRSGTETVTRNLALGLLARGHHPIVFTNALGPIAEELRRATIPVTNDITQIAASVDVIHGHHSPVTAIAITRFPTVPALFLAHDFYSWFDAPPALSSIHRYLAVDEAVASRLVSEHGYPSQQIGVLLNAVDMQRFELGPSLPERPVRALAFAKNKGHLDAIRQACRLRGIVLDTAGTFGERVLDLPERQMLGYDLIFASALTALEAMACGRAVIVCDGRGLAGMVTLSNFDRWRPLNFGARTLRQRLDVESIVREIDAYSAIDAHHVAICVRRDADLERWLDAIEAEYWCCVHQPSPVRSDDARHLSLARHWQLWQPRIDTKWPWLEEREQLVDQIARLGCDLSPLQLRATVKFSQSNLDKMFQLAYGFSSVESWGVWTDGDVACMRVCLPIVSAECLVRISFVLAPLLHRHHTRLDAEIMIDGNRMTNWQFDVDSDGSEVLRDVSFLMQPRLLPRPVWITFRIKSPVSAQQLGESDDARRLGLGFVSFYVSEPSAVVDDRATLTPLMGLN
jgi:hypothetical protein